MQEQQEIVAELKLTMAHAQAEHLVSLRDIKKVVRDSSLEKIAVEKERVERTIEIKKVVDTVVPVLLSFLPFHLSCHSLLCREKGRLQC